MENDLSRNWRQRTENGIELHAVVREVKGTNDDDTVGDDSEKDAESREDGDICHKSTNLASLLGNQFSEKLNFGYILSVIISSEKIIRSNK